MTTAAEIKKLYIELEAAESSYEIAYNAYFNDGKTASRLAAFGKAEYALLDATAAFRHALVDFANGELSWCDTADLLRHKRTDLDMWMRSLAA